MQRYKNSLIFKENTFFTFLLKLTSNLIMFNHCNGYKYY